MTPDDVVKGLRAKAWQSSTRRNSAGSLSRHNDHVCWKAADLIERRAAEIEAMRAKLPGREVEGWSLQPSIYEHFSTEIWHDKAERGKRSIAIVRDYSDAVKIMAALSRLQSETPR